MQGESSKRSAARVLGARALFGASGVLVALALLRLWIYLGAAPDATLPEALAGPDRERPTLLFVFHHRDCVTYEGLVRRWNGLHASGELAVRGVALDLPAPGGGGAGSGRAAIRPDFPVRVDLAEPAERMLLRLGVTRTPATVLLDGRGRPRLVLPPETADERQDHALGLVREFAATLLSKQE